MWNWKQRCIEDNSTRTGCSSLPCKFCYVCVNEWYAWHMDCCSHAVPFRISSVTELDVTPCVPSRTWHILTQLCSTHILCHCRGSSKSLCSIPENLDLTLPQCMQSCHGICHVHIVLCICKCTPASLSASQGSEQIGRSQTDCQTTWDGAIICTASSLTLAISEAS